MERLALAVLRSHGGVVETQEALREELARRLRLEDATYRVGAGRLRRLLLASRAIHLEVRYALRPLRRPLEACPVCQQKVRPIRNRTLFGDTVVTGYRCSSCAFWTPLKRRVPARYVFRALR